MRIISENIANADSTPSTPGADPYRRKMPTFQSEFDRALDVAAGRARHACRPTVPTSAEIRARPSGRRQRTATSNIPNVNPLVEMTDMREAQRSYEANINVISATRRMIQRTIDILKA